MSRKTKYKIGSGFAPFSPCVERFVTGGYREAIPLKEQVGLATEVKGLRGIALDYPYQFGDADIGKVKGMLTKSDFELSTLEIGLYPDRKWKLGTFTAGDAGIRRSAIKMSQHALDVAGELGAYDVLLWPGQDGFDYPFQVDYSRCWKLLIDGIGEVAGHRPDIRIAIEYKPKEPRSHLFVRNAGVLLHLLREIGLANVGATIDFGHSLVAGENPAEAVNLLADAGKLFQVHVNDNYRDWDHDLMVGTISFWETLEFFYWIIKSGYSGWYIVDVFPYREDGLRALQRCVQNTEKLLSIAKRLQKSNLTRILKNMDAVAASDLLWKLI